MNVTKSKGGLLYLAIGVFGCFVFAAVGAANTQDVNFGVLMASIAFIFYLVLYEIAAFIKASTKPVVVVAGGLGLIVCFSGIGAVTNAVISGGDLDLLGRGFWILPLAIAFWTAREVYNRKRPNAPI